MGGDMTATAELLTDLQALGVILAAEGDRLRFHPKDKVTPELLAQLRTCKGELMAMFGTGYGNETDLATAETYTAQFFDGHGRRRKAPTKCQDKAEALRYANHLENQARKRRTGEIDVKAERYGKEGRRPLSEHLAEFHEYLSAKQNCPKYVRMTYRRVAKLLDSCKAQHIADMTDAAVMAAIGAMKADGMSLQTCNHYIRGVKQFSRWLKLQKRTPDDALAGQIRTR